LLNREKEVLQTVQEVLEGEKEDIAAPKYEIRNRYSFHVSL